MSFRQPTTQGDRPLRILTVLTFYHPHWTGLTVLARHLAEGLAAGGAEVSVLTSRHDRDLPRRDTIAGVDVHRLRTAGRVSRTLPMPAFPAALLRLVRRHDVVHLHSPMAEAGLVRWACRAAGRPLVVTHQGDVVMPPGLPHQAVQRLMTATLSATFRAADRVVTHNDDYLAASLTAVAGSRALAIEPPVDFAPPRPGAAAALRRRQGWGDRPIVAFAGRWVEEKGFDVLLQAAPRVLARRPDTLFVVAGERSVAYERFSQRCAPLVDALGPAFVDLGLVRDRRRLAAFYAAADVFVLPSRTDCLASVQIEALLCGTPVVATDIPGARSVVRSTGAGLLVPPEDPEALADAIVAVADDPRRFADRIADVPARYDPDRAVKRYRALLDEVVAEPRHGGGRRRERAAAPEVAPVSAAAPVSVPVSPPARAVDLELDRQLDHLLANELDMAYRRRVRWALERLALRPGDRLLDAGTGLGNVLHVAERAAPGATAVGVDRSAERLGRARAEGVAAPVARADLLDLPVPGGAFDAVLCSEVLEHLDDDRVALVELRRVLRPGGRLVVTVPHADYPFAWDPINRTLERLGRRPIRRGPVVGIWTDHVRLYRPADLRERLRTAGFVVDEVDEQTHHALPFTHLLLYGLGRALVERRMLPAAARRAASRYQPGPEAVAGDGRRHDSVAVGLVRRVLHRADRRNDHLPPGTRSFVSLVAAAHVPVADRDLPG
ncbi:MAG TPA: glycosyltransferase [Acidimicrobiales bacterium]|nr:glycosyltransferase [Acidimicrobiales bacterium]